MTITLNLPNPSNELINMVRVAANNSPINYQSLDWHKSLQPSHINCAAGNFFVDTQVKTLALYEYQNFFTDEISPLVGVIRNTGTSPATYPPHSDRLRFVAINYYIETGGDNVQTVFYDKLDDKDDLVGGHVLSCTSLPDITHSEHFTNGHWYAVSTRQYHSVENIQTERIILTIWIKIATFDDFLSKYNHLIV